jgi:hypothetical protein
MIRYQNDYTFLGEKSNVEMKNPFYNIIIETWNLPFKHTHTFTEIK